MIADVTEKLNAVRTAIASVLVTNLTPTERMNMLKMGDKTLAFVRRALNFAAQNPALVPSYLNLEEAWRDYKLTEAISILLKELATLQRGLEDTAMVAGRFAAGSRFFSGQGLPSAEAAASDGKVTGALSPVSRPALRPSPLASRMGCTACRTLDPLAA